MIEVSVAELKKNVDKLQKIIDEYENIQLNIFNQLKESTLNWQDGNSIKFNDSIYLEKKETDLFFQSLQNKKKIYEYICNKYGEIGNRIKCSLNDKQSLFYEIDNCYNEVVDLLREFNKIDTSFYFNEQDLIFLQQQKISKVKNELKNMKISVSNFFNKIEFIENEIKEKINNLDEIKVNDLNFYWE